MARGNHVSSQKTIFQDIIINEQVSSQEKETEHLVTEGQAIVGVGAGTTTGTLTIKAFYLPDKPNMYAQG